MPGLAFLIPLVGILAACSALGVCRASYYRAKGPRKLAAPRPRSHRALSDQQRAEVLAVLDSDEHADKAPAQVYAALLDDQKHRCSVRTMYRVLADAGQVRERRDQRRHPSAAIAHADEGDVRRCASIAVERHRAIDWLQGEAAVYSEVSAST